MRIKNFLRDTVDLPYLEIPLDYMSPDTHELMVLLGRNLGNALHTYGQGSISIPLDMDYLLSSKQLWRLTELNLPVPKVFVRMDYFKVKHRLLADKLGTEKVSTLEIDYKVGDAWEKGYFIELDLPAYKVKMIEMLELYQDFVTLHPELTNRDY